MNNEIEIAAAAKPAKKRNILDPAQQAYRAEFCADIIIRSGKRTRNFDAALAQGDGDFVKGILYRRALKNPKLAANLPNYISPAEAEENYRLCLFSQECSQCASVKPLKDFIPDSRKANGRDKRCRDCHNAARRAKREATQAPQPQAQATA